MLISLYWLLLRVIRQRVKKTDVNISFVASVLTIVGCISTVSYLSPVVSLLCSLLCFSLSIL